ncbi:hypothetical protein BaRGS_00009524 [Batillaria attramentaria]|uniref:Uncharacterized protein n=1 Tax=Batillaria attramentaria TaxID=370345 RepID=A0ABD0LI93_9CAEN
MAEQREVAKAERRCGERERDKSGTEKGIREVWGGELRQAWRAEAWGEEVRQGEKKGGGRGFVKGSQERSRKKKKGNGNKWSMWKLVKGLMLTMMVPWFLRSTRYFRRFVLRHVKPPGEPGERHSLHV